MLTLGTFHHATFTRYVVTVTQKTMETFETACNT